MRAFRLILAVPALAGCGSNPALPPQADVPAEPVVESPVSAEPREPLRGLEGEVISFKPDPSRDRSDRIAGCSHMNPETRPRGSNCYGIFPEECGADRALAHKGEVLTPALQQRIIAYSPTADVRFIHSGDVLIEDLRHGRLNIGLSDEERITSVDCF